MKCKTTPSQWNLNIETYRDKVLGCWTGKNIGGTLGGPLEGPPVIHDVTFYTQEMNGNPLPNDDLDLQLSWLQAVEENGVYSITPRLLGEYWLDHVTGPWCEYSVCKANIKRGFYPPVSGVLNNNTWKFSNGAWIRSELWACLFPGQPDEAALFASFDACADHCGEGIYAEMFTAAMESAAFVVSDLRKLIAVGLSKIPENCRIARAVKLVCEQYDEGRTWLEAREAVALECKDLGWFQAPDNIAFTILGLLYGEGDFGKSLCTAVNCGDDTDCTGATAGSILGIILGRKGLPQKWIEPIGESIQTVAVNPFPFNLKVPKTLSELTDRVMAAAFRATFDNPALLRLTHGETTFDSAFQEGLKDSEMIRERVWNRSPWELVFDLPYGELAVEYMDTAEIEPGRPSRLKISFFSKRYESDLVNVTWRLPEGWSAPGGTGYSIRKYSSSIECVLIPGDFPGPCCYIPLEVLLNGRFNPVPLSIPFQRKGAACHDTNEYPPLQTDRLWRTRLRQQEKI